MYCTLYMICSGFLHQHHPGGALLWGSSDRRWWRLHDGRLRPSLRPRHWAQHSAALHLLPSLHEHRGYASMQNQMRKKVVEEYELPVYLFCLPLQSRWAEFCKEPPSPRTSRSDLTSPVLCLDRMEVWCPTRLTSPSTWEPCRRLSSTRWGTNSPAMCEWVFLSVAIHVEWQKDVVVFSSVSSSDHLGISSKKGMWFWVTTHLLGAAISQTSQWSHRSVHQAFQHYFFPQILLLFFLHCLFSFLFRCLEKEWAALCSLWPAGGTTPT